MLIYIQDETIQAKLEKEFNMPIPLYCVFDTVVSKNNSPLWYEMFRPDEEIMSNLK